MPRMKYILYKFINSLGFNVFNKRKKEKNIREKLSKYKIDIHRDLLYSSAAFIFQLEKVFDDISISENERFLIVKFQGLTFEIESTEEFLILTEIFIAQEYNFICNAECAVIDIGANIGIASVFFSQKEFVKKIYCFEPIEDTFKIARENFRSNQIDKIQGLFNYGLGGSNRIEKFLFNKNLKGNSGIRGLLSPSYNRSNIESEIREVDIKKASDVLKPIFIENPDLRIVVKMDCEGAEYEIIEDLAKEDILKEIDLIIIEWHDLGSAVLEEYLVNNNFTIFSRSLGNMTGIIYGKNENII